jgi:hypothetical protein
MNQSGGRRQVYITEVVFGQADIEELLTELLVAIPGTINMAAQDFPHPVETNESGDRR